MQLFINLKPVSLSNKKIDFSEEKCHGKCLQEHLGASGFQNVLGGGMPPDPLKARAFGARNLHRLVLKSGYGPASAWKAMCLYIQ